MIRFRKLTREQCEALMQPSAEEHPALCSIRGMPVVLEQWDEFKGAWLPVEVINEC
jgi:hypothetical protein